MDRHSTDSSDSDDLPSYTFLNLKPKRSNCGQAERAAVSVVPSLGCESAAALPTAAPIDPCAGKQRDAVMISSESEGEEVFVPLAVRLKQRFRDPVSSLPPVNHTVDPPACQPVVSVPKHQPEPVHHRDGPLCPGPEECEKGSNFIQRAVGSLGSRAFSEADMLLEEGGSSPGRRVAKHSVAEIKASREEALKRRADREKQQADRETQRLLLERQRAERKVLLDATKALRPEECIKHMVVSVDPALLQLEGGGTLLSSLHALGCSCAIERQAVPSSIAWARRTPGVQCGDAQYTQETHMVVHVPVDDFITMVHNCNHQEQRSTTSDCGQNLTEWTRCLLAQSRGRFPSLAVIGIEKYFRLQKSQGQKNYRKAVLGTHLAAPSGKGRKRKDECGKLPELSRVALEEALVDLQLCTGVQVRFLATWKDFCDYVTMSTKAVAEAPFKREREQTGFSFCLENEWAGGQRVDRDGRGLLQVWKRQVQQLNRVSADMAGAVLTAYPSPQLLAQAYSKCRSEQEKLSLLSDVLIRRGEGVTSTTRRVGPELSKRLFLLMTSSDPNQTLDSMGAAISWENNAH